ncbi:MAG: Na+/H+ antiporter NhaA [Sphingomicrobium sp.]
MSANPQHQAMQDRLAGLLLIAGAAAALLLANSPLNHAYHAALDFRAGPLTIHQWIADAAMALFFLLVGLEVKREWYEGRLSTPDERRLPIIAAGAGMVIPALIFLTVTGFDPVIAPGWAIPAATDIAFALGILALLGARAPPQLKLLLVTIAIIDDVGAVAIIAFAYTADLHWPAIAASALILGGMFGLNRLGVQRLWPYLAGFVLLWIAVHESGVHATIAGVLAALAIPLRNADGRSPVKRLENHLHEIVMLGVVPLFGLASAGVALTGDIELTAALPLGVALGLLVGKPIGVFGAIWLADRTGLASRPAALSWPQVGGSSILCGVGFTMSLFIGALAFPGDAMRIDEAKLGTLAGSLVAGILGFVMLRFSTPLPGSDDDREEAGEIFGCDEEEEELQ